MWLDAYLQSILIRAQIADAQRQAALRHLVQQARASNHPGPPRPSLREHIVRSASKLWAKGRIERAVLP